MTVLYGSTFQSFRFFNLTDPGGAADAVEYVKISRGDPDVDLDGPHFYRWLTPAAARLVLPISESLVSDPDFATRLSFYFVNFAFSTATGVILFALLQAMGFSVLASLIGLCLFASSRATVLVTATPMVDAAYYCAIAAVCYLTVANKTVALALLLPVLVLSKETVIPFLLLPLLTPMRRSPAVWAGLAVAGLTFVVSGRLIDATYATQGPSLADSVWEHLDQIGTSLQALGTPAGLHDLQSGFSFLIALAAVGAWLNARHRSHAVPVVVVATLPIALVLALLSGNAGRMIFAAFPAVIAYALVAIEQVAGGRRDSR